MAERTMLPARQHHTDRFYSVRSFSYWHDKHIPERFNVALRMADVRKVVCSAYELGDVLVALRRDFRLCEHVSLLRTQDMAPQRLLKKP